MRKPVLFVQGGGQGAHVEDARLVASLAKELGPDYEIHYPVMPRESTPDYSAWNPFLIELLAPMGADVILVGHSVGATIVVWSLAENQPYQKLAGVFLIAPPFVGAGGWQIEGFTPPRDIGAKIPDVPIYLYHGQEDEIVPFAHVDLYARALPQAFIRRLAGRDHQLNNDLSDVARDIRGLNASRAP
jgi:predicted alpha/beta hydrolase family esterase